MLIFLRWIDRCRSFFTEVWFWIVHCLNVVAAVLAVHIFVPIARILFVAPFEFLAALFGRIHFCCGWLNSKTTGPLFSIVAAAFHGAIGYFLHVTAKMFFFVWESRLAKLLVYPFWILLGSIYDWFYSWFVTRKLRDLLLALPTLILLGLLSTIVIGLSMTSTNELQRHYRQAAFVALHDGNQEEAELLYRKLKQLGGLQPSEAYRNAIHNVQTADTAQAYVTMKELADTEQGGYGPAHLWIANALIRGEIQETANRRQELIETHLQHAARLLPQDPKPLQLLAEHYRSCGSNQQAQLQLVKLAALDLNAQNRAKLALTLHRWGAEDEAKRAAAEAVSAFRNHNAESVNYDLGDFTLWESCCEIIKDRAAAIDVLQQATQKFPDDEEFRDQAIQQCVRFLRTADRVHWSHVAVAALQFAPQNEFIQIEIANQCRHPSFEPQVQQLLRANRRDHQLSPNAFMRLADANMANGKPDQARHDYAEILRLDATNHRAANNLAIIFAGSPPIDLEQALEMADQAVELRPHEAYVRETRGQILLKLRRWKDAAAEFEIALNGLPNYLPLHESLAECYREMGEHELANLHSEQAKTKRRTKN